MADRNRRDPGWTPCTFTWDALGSLHLGAPCPFCGHSPHVHTNGGSCGVCAAEHAANAAERAAGLIP